MRLYCLEAGKKQFWRIHSIYCYYLDECVMKKALVTGGMGFIGSHLVHALLAKGIEVTVIDKAAYKPTYHRLDGATILEGDVLSHELLHECLKEVDTCFHLAALSSVALCNRDWIFSHEVNVLAFNGLLEEIRRLEKPIRLIYASSAAVYGESMHQPLIESEHVSPNSTYGADKLSNEIYAEVMYRAYGISSVGLRLFNVYGPGQLASNPYTGVMTSFKRAIVSNQSLKIFGDGLQTRDFINIQDVVRAFMIAADYAEKTHCPVFNICSGQGLSIGELAKVMLELSGKDLPIENEAPRQGDMRHALGSPLLAMNALGFRSEISLEQGLKQYLEDTSFDF